MLQVLRKAYSARGGVGLSGGSVDWQSVLETALGSVLGVIAGWLITARYARRGSQELRREAERLRQLTLKLIRILAAADQIELSECDPETDEPSSWPVGIEAKILYNVEAPTPLWKRLWRRVFGG
jgi:hypothetical protein